MIAKAELISNENKKVWSFRRAIVAKYYEDFEDKGNITVRRSTGRWHYYSYLDIMSEYTSEFPSTVWRYI